MRTLILLSLFTLALHASAQKNLPEYKASNGITYTAGDTVKLGTGSGPSHEFLYFLTSGGVSLQRGYSRATVVIKKIHRVKFRAIDKVYLETIPGRNLLYIEDAIATCEIADACRKEQPAVASPDKSILKFSFFLCRTHPD